MICRRVVEVDVLEEDKRSSSVRIRKEEGEEVMKRRVPLFRQQI